MPKIHPSSLVDPKAELADDVEIGPFCMVEAGVKIGAGSKLVLGVSIRSGVTVGERNIFEQGCAIGGDPQDRKFGNEPTFLHIGNDNFFREYVTLHRATGEGNTTTIGDHCYLMAYCHVGHNTTLHNGITMANACQIAGHVTIEDLATLGGKVGVHQFVRVGKSAMIGAATKLTRDAPPFMLTEGPHEEVHDINAVGLRRLGVTPDARLALHKACKLIYKSQLGLTNALATVRREVTMTPEVEYLIAYEERRFRGKNGRGDQR